MESPYRRRVRGTSVCSLSKGVLALKHGPRSAKCEVLRHITKLLLGEPRDEHAINSYPFAFR